MNGTPPRARADGTDFGTAPFDGGLVTHTFVIRNPGATDLLLASPPDVAVHGQGGSFRLATAPASAVAPGATTTFTLAFAPVVSGLSGATVRIASNVPDDTPFTFDVIGRWQGRLAVASVAFSNRGQSTILTLTGQGFQAGTTVQLVRRGFADVTAADVTVADATRITCTVDLAGTAPGAWRVVVTSPDGRTATGALCAPLPRLDGFRIARGAQRVPAGGQATLDLSTSGSPSRYRVDCMRFDGAAGAPAWRDLPTAGAPTWTVADGGATLRLFVQVASPVGTSAVLSDSVAVDPPWAATWVGTYEVTSHSGAAAAGYKGRLETGDLVAHLAPLGRDGRARLRVALLGLTATVDVDAAGSFDIPATPSRTGDTLWGYGGAVTAPGAEARLDMVLGLDHGPSGWHEQLQVRLSRAVAGALPPALDGLWVLEPVDVSRSGWAATSAGEEPWYETDGFSATPVGLLRVSGDGTRVTAQDVLTGAAYRGALEPDGAGGAVLNLARLASGPRLTDYLSASTDADGSLAGSGFRRLTTGRGANTAGEAGVRLLSGTRYDGTGDTPDGVTAWTVALTPSAAARAAAVATAEVRVNGHRLVVAFQPAGAQAAVTLRGWTYSGWFAVQGGGYELHGRLPTAPCPFTGTFRSTADGENTEGTAEWDDGMVE